MTMIPLTDTSRRPTRYPAMTTAIILMNVLVFVLEIMGGESFVRQWSVTPADIVSGKNWLTIFSAMFMHGGWMHIIGNMVFLHAFGPEVEDAMGRLSYLTFYLLSGIAATAAQVLIAPFSHVPNLGASGAIAGVMGAFLITYPRDRIRVLFFFFIFVRTAMIPAAALIGVWFLLHVFSQVGSVVSVQSGGVVYMAHIGGCRIGAVTARFFETPRLVA